MAIDSFHDGLMTIEEACRFTKVSRSRLYQLLQCGHLMSLKLGKSRRIPKAGLVAFLEAHMVNTEHLRDTELERARP
jgi:excisionase family DNA binding protein